MNSLIVISPERNWGFKPILYGNKYPEEEPSFSSQLTGEMTVENV